MVTRHKTRPTTFEVLEYADEFGERFPDQPDYQILDSCGDFAETSFDETSPLARALIVAYEQNATAATAYLQRTWGIDVNA